MCPKYYRVASALVAVTVLYWIGLLDLDGVVWAEEKVVHVMSWGGDYEKQLTKVFEPLFKAETGYTLKYFVKISANEMVGTIRAEQSTPSIDVTIGNEGAQAAAPDVWAEVDRKDLPNMKSMYPLATIPGSGRVSAFAGGPGIIYNKEALEKAHIDPPKRWADLWESRFRGKVAIPDPTNVYGYCLFVAATRLQGGDERNLGLGYPKMMSLIPSLVTVVRGGAQVTDALSTALAWAVVYSECHSIPDPSEGNTHRICLSRRRDFF